MPEPVSAAPSAAPSAATSLSVDYQGLARLGAQLEALARELSTRDGSLQYQLADPEIHEALRHADRDWAHQRQRLHEFVRAGAQALAQTTAAYRNVDAEISAAACAVGGK